MRYAFTQELLKLAKKDKNIMLLTGDLGYSVFEAFEETLPKQFVNMGVAEANMMGVAAGLALSGKIVFAYSISTFASLRAYESIRNDICLQKAHVIIVGSGSGLSYSILGPSHHGVEDIAIMNVLPNMNIFSPADPTEARWATEEAVRIKKPAYLRLGKRGEPGLYDNKPHLRFGKGSILKSGKDFVIFSTGNIVNNCLIAVNNLEKKGIKGTLVSLHTLKPIDEDLIRSITKSVKNVFTAEEHHQIGGLGTIVADIIARNNLKINNFIKIGLPDVFITSLGDQNFLQRKFKLDPKSIEAMVLNTLK